VGGSQGPCFLGNQSVAICIPDDETKFSAIKNDFDEEPFSPSDQEILRATTASRVIDISDDDEEELQAARQKKAKQLELQRDSYEPFAPKVLRNLRILPPPASAAGSATAYLSKEVKSIMATQAKSSPQELGFYFDPSTTNDNIFHWIVEMVGFDDLPLGTDMEAKKVKGVIFEVLFPAQTPFEPPFFRVIHPRFLPFTQGGGGHVTGGGSICMDLLTSSGWLSSYTCESILMQIKLALSNLEPKPARLHPSQWDVPYSVQEAIDGFRRAAATHGWKVQPNLDAVAHGTVY
jgi:ubiquitin-conjugating enzyme E2 Q